MTDSFGAVVAYLTFVFMFDLVHVAVEAVDGIIDDLLIFRCGKVLVVVASDEDALEFGTVEHDVAMIFATALEGRVSVGNGLARGAAETFGDGANVVGRPIVLVESQGLVGKRFCTVIILLAQCLQGTDGIIQRILGCDFHCLVDVALEEVGACAEVQEGHAAVDISGHDACALVDKVSKLLTDDSGVLDVLLEFLKLLLSKHGGVRIIARLLHLAVQRRLVLRLLCIKLTLQGLDFIALVEALLEVLEVVIIDRRPDGGMDDKSVVGVILRECAILNLHRLDADNFYLVIRQLEVLRLRIGTHVYSCLLCSCAQGRLFGVLLRCSDGVILTHLIDARCLDRLCPGLSKRHAAE